ncbi:MAG: hypothetical protein ABFD00_06510 [Chloroherpetonaceae bacterium]
MDDKVIIFGEKNKTNSEQGKSLGAESSTSSDEWITIFWNDEPNNMPPVRKGLKRLVQMRPTNGWVEAEPHGIRALLTKLRDIFKRTKKI